MTCLARASLWTLSEHDAGFLGLASGVQGHEGAAVDGLGVTKVSLLGFRIVPEEQHNERLDSLRLALEAGLAGLEQTESVQSWVQHPLPASLASGAAEGCRAGGPAGGLCRGTTFWSTDCLPAVGSIICHIAGLPYLESCRPLQMYVDR